MEKFNIISMKLSKIATVPSKNVDKEKTKEKAAKLAVKIGEIQNILYAENKHKVLIILQGMDASGKDGSVKNLTSETNVQGVRVVSFKVPNAEEFSYDFLWRVHKVAPPKGMIHIFNRSQYEDILVNTVHGYIPEKDVNKRYQHIADFEKMLVETGTTILKFYLHISKEEQLIRLEERKTNPAKNWKYNPKDFEERKLWDSYMKTYEKIFEDCGKPVKWDIIPADKNWYRDYLIAEKVYETLKSLKCELPKIEIPKTVEVKKSEPVSAKKIIKAPMKTGKIK
jgi:PPK2 family polyphosphate:nucleotide phosphotransferase